MKKKIRVLILAMCMILNFMPCIYAADIVESGTCGSDAVWTLDSDGLLTISGEGEMSLKYNTSMPGNGTPYWYDVRLDIKKVIIEDGITNICDFAFEFCENMTSVTIPNSVADIDRYAFSMCKGLTEITIPISISKIYDGVFFGCTAITDVYLYASRSMLSDKSGIPKTAAVHSYESITDMTVEDIPSTAYTGSAIEPSITVSDGDTVVSAECYSTEYRDNVSAGTASVTISGTGIEDPITHAKYMGSRTVSFEIQKAMPNISPPTGIIAFEGQTLSDVKLPDNWEWKDASAEAGTAGIREFEAVYTPSDTDNYIPVTLKVSVEVRKYPKVIKTDTGFTVKFEEKHYRCTVYTAVYDEYDRLLRLRAIPLKTSGTTDISLALNDGSYAKVFVWTDKLEPLLDNAERFIIK